MALEKTDLELLGRAFPAAAHKFIGENAYLHEEPIAERLDEVDPSWQWEIKTIVSRANAGEGGKDVGTVTVHGSLTIKGVTRHGVGMAVIQRTNEIKETRWDDSQRKKVETGRSYTNEANEAEKAATTDAFKRTARMFGIGRYLLTLPKENGKATITSIPQLENWLKVNYPAITPAPVYHDESPAESASLDPDDYIPQSTIVPSKPAHDAWFKELKALTAPFYVGNEKDHDFSLNGLIQNGTVKRDLAADTAAVYVFMHRIAKDFGFSPDDLKEILGMSLNDFRKKKNGTLAQAWNMAVAQYKRLEQAS